MQRMKELFFSKKLEKESKTTTQEHIVVVGAGLIGLSTIAALMKDIAEQKDTAKQYKISLIEKRNFNFERSQKLVVRSSAIVPGLERGLSWKEFTLQLFDPNNIYAVNQDGDLYRRDGHPISQLNKREKFIRKMLRPRPKERISATFSIKSLQYALLEYIDDAANKPPNLQIEKTPETTVSGIEIPSKRGSISLEIKNKMNQKNKIAVNTLLLCEGEKREATEIMNKAIRAKKQKPFNFLPIYKPKTFHSIVRLKFKSLDEIENGKFKNYQELFDAYSKPKDLTSEDYKKRMEELNKLGWTSETYPTGGVNTNFVPSNKNSRPIFGLSCELPKHIFNMAEDTPQEIKEKHEKIIEWASLIAAHKYRMPVEYFEFDKKGGDNTENLRITTFSPELEYADTPWREINGANILLMGDCAMSPHHDIGNSARMGMNIATHAAKTISSTSKDVSDRFDSLLREHYLFVNYQAREISKQTNIELSEEYSNIVAQSKLIDAINAQDYKKVKSLLCHGEDPNILCKGVTPLWSSIAKGDLKMTKELLKSGANPNLLPSALGLAIELEDLNTIKLLFSYGVNPHLPPKFLENLIKIAGAKQNIEIMTQLLISGVKPDGSAHPIYTHSNQAKKVKEAVEIIPKLLTRILSTPPSLYFLSIREQVFNELKKEGYQHVDSLKPFCSYEEVEKIMDAHVILQQKKEALDELDKMANKAFQTDTDLSTLEKCFDQAYLKILEPKINKNQIIADLKNDLTSNLKSEETTEQTRKMSL